MKDTAKAIRTFLGAKDYQLSRKFYRALGFEEIGIGPKMCLFRVNASLGFYLQDHYVKDWVENSMVVLEVDDLDVCAADLLNKDLPEQFEGVRISEIKNYDWGRELFMYDPSGVLWHFCEFPRK